MKKIFSLLILLTTAVFVNAEEKPTTYGFLNVVNLIPGKASCEIKLATKQLIPSGLKAGSETGWFMLPVGKHPIAITRHGHLAKESDIEVAKGVSKLIIIYAEPARDSKPPRIGFTSLPAFTSTGFALKFMSTCATGESFQLARKTFEAKRFEIVDISNWNGGGFELKHLDKPIGAISRGRERASYYVLVGNDNAGNYLTAIINADPQELPPWMKQPAEDESENPPAEN
jgi:hypothetical protein